MRLLILITAATLGLAGCGTDEQANNTVNIDQAVLSNDLAANDVTAIDAVTGAAANMAADVEIDFTNDMLERASPRDNARAEAPERPRRASPRPESNSAATTTPAPEPAANETD